MKFATSIIISALASSVAALEACQTYKNKDVLEVEGGIVWQFWETNPPAWSWNANKGSAVVQDNGAVYFDGDGRDYSATIRISYNDGTSALVQPPNGRKGWCQLPSGMQNNIQNIESWD